MYLNNLNTSLFLNILFFRTQPTILNELWANVDRIIAKMQRSRIPVPGDGFCFLSLIVEALDNDHNIQISVPQAMQLILDYLLHNYEKYVDFFSCQFNSCQPPV